MSEQVRRKLKAAMQENARLQAELTDLKSEADRFKAEVERLRNLAIKIDGYFDLVRHENERLRKAGDAMLGAIKVSDPILDWKIELWNAAKEGKPSV